MNASAHPTGCDGRGWLAARAGFACAVLATSFAMLPAPLATAADWSSVQALSGPQAGETVIADAPVVTSPQHIDDPGTLVVGDDENAFLPGSIPPEFTSGEPGFAVENPALDSGVAAHEFAPLEGLGNGLDDELHESIFISDDFRQPPRRCPRWTAQVDALLLWQTNIPSRSLFVDSVTNQTVLDANHANPPVSAAPRFALLHHRDPCHAFEINYFQIQSFTGTAAVGPGANTYATDNLPGSQVSNINAAQINTSAGLKSWEFNLRRSQGGFVTWIGGFRWVEWNQRLAMGDLKATGATGVDGYLVNTGNNLYGGQFGADALLWNAYRKVKVNGLAKGGVYYNYQAYQNTTLSGDQAVAPPASNTLGASKDALAFVGEVGLTGEYKLAEWLSWRAGYTLFWLGGIATPANQLALSDFTAQATSINTYSSAFLHGATTGLEARW